MKLILILNTLLATLQINVDGGLLYPRESECREVMSLDGLWKFSLTYNGKYINGSLTGDQNDHDVLMMPVPSSYNDILTTLDGRDHIGPVTYERSFFLPYDWVDYYTTVLRFGSVCYSATVYVNNELVGTHEVGHLPFAIEIDKTIIHEGENTIKVVVENNLTATTLPQGSVVTYPSGKTVQTYNFDFYNYAGIDRSVVLYEIPNGYVDDISLITTIDGTTGVIDYEITKGGAYGGLTLNLTILDKDENEIYSAISNLTGTIKIENATFWWPYLMHDTPGYLYTFRVDLLLNGDLDLFDRYEQPFGIRQLAWSNDSFTINGKPIYFRGFSRHEDADIRGKGFDLPVIIRDHNLIRWTGANSYRTSNYPYAEEIMDLADQLGIMIINELPAAGLHDFNHKELFHTHRQAITDLYQRDKNRPSVVMWSIADNPLSNVDTAKQYFSEITSHIRAIDSTRPITIPNNYAYTENEAQFIDILSINKFEAWDEYPGDVDVIVTKIVELAKALNKQYDKLVMVTEYGAEDFEAYHSLPSYVWSEEYEMDLLNKHFEAFDQLRKEDWFIGEMVFSFTDFKTAPSILKVGTDRKGIFTRQRQPKASAYSIRQRYWSLAKELDDAVIPSGLNDGIIKSGSRVKQEL